MIGQVRTTIELPSSVHAWAKRYAQLHRQSLSSALGAIVSRAAATEDTDSSSVQIDPATGFPYLDLHLGRTLTQAEVAELLDED